MKFTEKKTGYVIATPVRKDAEYPEFKQFPSPSGMTQKFYLTGTDKEEFTLLTAKPAIFPSVVEAKVYATSLDLIFKAQLTDSGDDVLYLIQEL
jgi:hypothetical protein